MGEAWLAAVAAVLVSLIGVVLNSGYMNRKWTARLTAAQGSETEARTTQITDKIARDWIVDLGERVDELQSKLDQAGRVERALVGYVVDLLGWARENRSHDAAPIPSVPDELIDKIGRN